MNAHTSTTIRRITKPKMTYSQAVKLARRDANDVLDGGGTARQAEQAYDETMARLREAAREVSD